MKVYLDIDGTLIHEDLTENYGKPAFGLAEFIIALRDYDTYWLTTHCTDGDATNAVRLMKKHIPEDLHADIERIRPTTWSLKKTEAIDWDSDFMWFDNDISPGELDDLKKCNENQFFIQVDLRMNPKQLIEITRDIL